MNIQSFIDRKRIAGAREHEGRQTDWAGWTEVNYMTAIVSELLDACAYAQKLDYEKRKYAEETGNTVITGNIIQKVIKIIDAEFPEHILEAACQEAEQEAETGIVNCPYCNTELLLWDELPDNSYIPDDVNVICCKECCEEFNVIIHNQFEFEVKQEAENG